MTYAMSDDEIRASYNTAKHKPNQVKVLAELNAVTVPEMRRKLLELGCDMQASTLARKPSVQSSRGPRKAPVDEARAMELYHAGKSDLDMAEMLGVSVYRVRQWRYDNNLMRECGASAHQSRRGDTSACRAKPPMLPEAETLGVSAYRVRQWRAEAETMSKVAVAYLHDMLHLSQLCNQLVVNINGLPAKEVQIGMQFDRSKMEPAKLLMEVII